MDTQSTLSIAAEIGIGVAGFSSIASAVLARSFPGKRLSQWLRLKTLLITSFGVTLLAYMPMVLGETPLDEAEIWFIASIVYFTWVLLNSVVAYRGREIQAVLQGRGAARGFALSTIVLVTTSLSLNLFNALALHESWPYLAALACGISIAFIQFGALLRALWHADSKGA